MELLVALAAMIIPALTQTETAEDHEIEHVRGMRHSAWRDTPRGVCCFVYDAGTSKKYERGDTLCNVNGTERIIRL